MKESEYNKFLAEVSIKLAPINQLLYEILIITTIYIIIDRIQEQSLYLSNNSSSVIILFAVLALALDVYIWNNPLQTFMFAAILVIYIRYNMDKFALISSFVNMTGTQHADAASISNLESTSAECLKPGISIPEMISLPYDTTNVKPYGIMAFDKTDSTINEIHDAYKSGQPPVTITDSQYAKIMLDELYKTPQYKAAHPPIQNSDSNLSSQESNGVGGNVYDNGMTIIAPSMSDEELLESFRHPKRQFLDSRWLQQPGIGTYNDNTLCKQKNRNGNSNGDSKNKDAICNVVPFGKKLEQCTNQDYSVSISQLDTISTNVIPNDEF